MKSCAIVAVLLVSLFATSMGVPAYKRMAYYQARSAPQRMMVMQQYVQQPQTHARSTAYIADESVSPGSYLKDCVNPEDAANAGQQAVEESVANDAEVGPYPAAGGQVSAEFEGSFADGNLDSGLSGVSGVSGVSGESGVSGVSGESGVSGVSADDVPAAEIPASADLPELPEAPAVDNQILGDDAYPSADALPVDNDAKVPREYNFENPAVAVPEPAVAPVAEDAIPELPAVPQLPELPEAPSVNPEQAPVAEEAIVPAEAPIAAAAAPAVPAVVPVVNPVAVAPPKRYLPPRKKVIVKLDEQSEIAEDDADVDADAYRPARVPNARRPVKGNGNAAAAKGQGKAPLPAGTFFPINFGGTSGGAIAIANSFSTGEGGSATSHAIAYGSPDAARSKARPARRH